MAALSVVSLVGLVWLVPSGAFLMAFLGVVILSHEAGHLLVARWVGMRPTEFFWGFGPEIVALEHNDCRYGLKLLFLGGYVRLIGMTPSSELPDGFDEADTYRAASHRGRLATILAGPVVNIVMAWLAFTAAAVFDGRGLGAALTAGGGDVWYVVSGTGQALWIWVANIGDYLGSFFDTTGLSEPPVRFMSPVSQAEVSGWAVGNGLTTTLRWFGILSCAVGVVNLLPLPPLDGSHALVAGVEGGLDRLRKGSTVRLDVTRLVPLAYVTIGVLVFLSLTALVMDIRDIT
ncbi:MAG: site-2 protease family protein [Actinomycetia bacterium]|nr:site-2 protease family protein [Actinomycetes bacterium]MCP4227229.1 site-2 protease family protein [Actinomycetes bacterium]